MKKEILSIFLMLCSLVILAQNEVGLIQTNYVAKTFKGKESVSISNNKTGELVILVEDKSETKLYLLDNTFKTKGVLTSKRLEANFKNFIGYSIHDNSYSIFFSDTYKKIFGVLSFNFEEKTVKQSIIETVFPKEKYIESISHKNRFFLMTASKKTADVNFYEYQGVNFAKKNAVSFEHFSYTDAGYKKTPIKLLRKKGAFAFSGNAGLVKIDGDSPNSIENASVACKLYQVGDNLIFTSDNQNNNTNIITININDFSAVNTSFETPKLDLSKEDLSFGFKHNSFYYNNLLYQLSMNSKQMKMIVKDIKTEAVVHEISLNKNDSITFKNGPIIQKGGANIYASRVRELEKTSKFLRKASSGKTGIMVTKIDSINQVTIGSFKEIKNGGGGFGAFGAIGGPLGGIPIGSFGPGLITFNPVGAAYYGHKSSKSTFINCVFNDQFKHIGGDSRDNIFDEIESYEDSFVTPNTIITTNVNEAIKKYGKKNTVPKLKNIFFHNGNHFYAYLDKKDRQYHLVKFGE